MDTMDNATERSKQAITFEDIVIRFTRQTYYKEQAVFRLRVLQSPSPLSEEAFGIDIEKQLKEFRANFTENVGMDQDFYPYSTQKESQIEDEEPQEIAYSEKELYNLLPKSFREDFPIVIQRILEKGNGIRLVLEASAEDQAYRLLSLPWELFFSQKTQAYLARSPRLIIIRRILNAVRRSPLPMSPPYKVLHVIADVPNHPHRSTFLKMNNMESDTIKQAVKAKNYGQAANPGSVEQMEAELSNNNNSEKPYQVLHFLGHGEETLSNNKDQGHGVGGYLIFISDSDNSDTRQWVSGEQLQQRLSATPSVQLIVLNACHGASAAADNIALELVSSGFPYVVAMQSQITVQAAERFTKAFYEALQEEQEIAYAVALGRSRIASELPGAPDWCLPAFYTNQGVQEKSILDQLAEQIWQWLGEAGQVFIPKASLLSGIFFLLVGLLLLLNGITPPLPQLSFLVPATIWLIAVPPLLVMAVYRSEQIKVPISWDCSARLALAMQLLEASSVGLGMALFPFLWVGLSLILSFGFWNMLAPAIQFSLLVPAFLLSILFSYSQALGYGRAFISKAKLKVPQFESISLSVITAGYMIILAPLALWIMNPWLIAPPLGPLLIGGMLIAFGIVAMIRLSDQ